MAAKKKTATRRGRDLVIVESPAKAKTIARYLGQGFVVEASIGHVRDLPEGKRTLPPALRDHPYAALGVDLDHDFEPLYVVPAEKRKHIQRLKSALKGAATLWLATDEDREGESISWHLLEVLKPPASVPVRRLVFNEITRTAIRGALEHPREVDMDLVRAQESRRILDRLYGYEVSPVLWRKIKKGLSAGRVQSVALRLLVEREKDRIAFEPSDYWDVKGVFRTKSGDEVEAALTHVGERRVAQGRDFDPRTGGLATPDVVVLDEAAARALAARLLASDARVDEVEEKPFTQRPAPPFTTSTLQQEAGRKLRFSAQRTMRAAQGLYENGLITYMRTDSTTLSEEGLKGARSRIQERFGSAFLPPEARQYQTRVKNAQEAHEAIRPAGEEFADPDDLPAETAEDGRRLYELIWKRTLASQMPDARGRRVTARIRAGDEATFRAGGRVIEFAGFMRAYVEDVDEAPDGSGEDRVLPPLVAGQPLAPTSLEPLGHTTQPPARFTEASLVKELDQRGIGRPSTWASIIQVLLDREYAYRKGAALVPSFTGFAVVRLLQEHFGDLLGYDFTARMEDELDEIAVGKLDSRDYLRRFYAGNGQPGLKDLVRQGLDKASPKEICLIRRWKADGGAIELRVGKFGLFVTDGEKNASLADDLVPDEFTLEQAREALTRASAADHAIGVDPETALEVFLRHGPYGYYVQLGETPQDSKKKPRRASLLRGMEPGDVDLPLALRLLSLPRDLGPHPRDDEGKSVVARVGRFGPYVQWGEESRSIPASVSVLDITLDEAVALLDQPRARGGRAAPTPLKELGAPPESGAAVRVLSGRYGPYVSDGKTNATIPKGQDPASIGLAEAVALLAERAARGPARRGRRKGARG